MNIPPREHTTQEKTIAQVLSEMELRFNEQEEIGSYSVDFWVPELSLVIEADGIHGHFKKRDIMRDQFLMSTDKVGYILHITDTTYTKIQEVLWRALTNF